MSKVQRPSAGAGARLEIDQRAAGRQPRSGRRAELRGARTILRA
jgi:hypothetical protein